MSGRPSTLNRQQLLGLLDAVAAEAERRKVRIELFMVGGGAIALAYNSDRTTTDIDGVFEPKKIVYEIAATVAANSDLDLPDTWLNDGVKGFLPGDDEHATVFYDEPGLSVRIPNPRYLFALKAMASREGDFDDLRTLWPHTGYANASEALDSIQDLYPRQTIKPAVQYTVEEVAALAAAADHPIDPQVTDSPTDQPRPWWRRLFGQPTRSRRPQPSRSGQCGRPTADGTPCKNPPGSCPHHP